MKVWQTEGMAGQERVAPCRSESDTQSATTPTRCRLAATRRLVPGERLHTCFVISPNSVEPKSFWLISRSAVWRPDDPERNLGTFSQGVKEPKRR